jgi:alpha-L-fucosidase 2
MTGPAFVSLVATLCIVACTVDGATVAKDIEYGSPGSTRLLLDASTPDGAGPFPVAIVVHGGGWQSGDKEVDPAPIVAALAKARFVSFSINYRFAPANRWPACFEDVKTAIRWVKAHAAEYHGDPNRIALIGYSAGGHLVCLAATTAGPDTQVQAVVGLAPPTDLELDLPERGGLSKPLQDLLDQPKEVTDASRKLLHDISAVNHIHPGLPPFLLIQGNADKSVPYAGSIAFAAKLNAAGVPCELITIANAPHRLKDWVKFDPDYASTMTLWLGAHLEPGATEPEAATQPISVMPH